MSAEITNAMLLKTLKRDKDVGQLSKIDHIVVLMLENRSFDSMLGNLYPKSDSFEGLDGSEKNLDPNGASVSVWSNTLPTPDNRGPPRVKPLIYTPSPQTAVVAQTKPLNDMQKALVTAAANLPEMPGKDIQTHLAEVRAGLKQPPPGVTANVHTARTFIKKQVGNFLQSNQSK